MKTRKTFGSVRDSSIRKLQGGMSLLGVFTLLSLGVLGSGCGGPVGPSWYGSQCSEAVQGADVQGGNFKQCVLNGVDLTDTNFSYANFDEAELYDTDFWIPSSLSGNPPTATLYRTEFTNVDATLADFSHALMERADFRPDVPWGTQLYRTEFFDTNLYKARFDGQVYLERANFKEANLGCANFQNADLTKADFTDAILLNADFTGATLTDAIFDGADVQGACFANAVDVVFTVAPDPNPTIGTDSLTPSPCVPFGP